MTDAIDHYCAAPFTHITNHAVGDDLIEYRPCCNWHGDSFKATDQHPDPFYHPDMLLLRADMLSNTYRIECKQCNNKQLAGVNSMRNYMNNEYGRPSKPKLRCFEFNIGNLCNMQCMMCSSGFSSKWMADDNKLNRKQYPLIRRKLSDIPMDLSGLDWLRLIGGELTLEQDTVLDTLESIKMAQGTLQDLKIEFVTNGLIPLRDDVIKILNECRQVRVIVSLDGTKNVNDYQRAGGDWDTVLTNIRLYSSISNFSTSVYSTITVFNVGNIPVFSDWMVENQIQHTAGLVYRPKQLAVRNLPEDYKNQLAEKFESWVPLSNINYLKKTQLAIRSLVLNEMNIPPEIGLDSVKSFVAKLDAINDKKLSDHVPELYSALFS
jgi:sulfatase maturation enzyme AslB (radical SAM superfamily)